MSLKERLEEYVRAAYSALWITSHEKFDAIREMTEMCRDQEWSIATWSIAGGLSVAGQSVLENNANDPIAALRATSSLSGDDQTTLLVLEDFHHFLQSPEVISTFAQQAALGKQTRTVLVVLSPIVRLPVELEKLIVVLEHALPSREQLRSLAAEVATEAGELPDGAALEGTLDAASGLTRLEAENAFALSLVRYGRLEPETLWKQKSQVLAKAGTLRMYEGEAGFGALGGLDSLKAFTRRAITRSSEGMRARGVMLLSPPGCGKSEFCKALGREVDRPVLQLDVGSLMGSLVGQSEERTRQALAIVDAIAPCVLMIDEVEKMFAGAGGSGVNDGGVSSRMFGTVLSWLNDHESDVFVVCTSNDASKLPPEFSRSERFDATFFLDLPGRNDKDAIWAMYLSRYGLEATQKRPDDRDWTGAEIKAACRLAALLDVPIAQSAQNVVPVAVTASESITKLRQWASGRCLDADGVGIYQHKKPPAKRRRSVARSDPSAN